MGGIIFQALIPIFKFASLSFPVKVQTSGEKIQTWKQTLFSTEESFSISGVNGPQVIPEEP